MSDITLREITEINKRMRLALHESRRLYRVSLNAMFASRKINIGVEGFIEVTSLLRDFSARLDKQVNNLAHSVTQSVYSVAMLIKLRKMLRLVEKAFSNANKRYKTLYIEDETKKVAVESERLVQLISSEIERSLMLIGVGENLAVLAKVEASTVPEEINNLDTITDDMEVIVVNINQHIAESRNYISQ